MSMRHTKLCSFLLCTVFLVFQYACQRTDSPEATGPGDNALVLLKQMPAFSNFEYMDLDAVEEFFAATKKETVSTPPKAELEALSFGNLSTLLSLPKASEQELRKLFPKGKRGIVAKSRLPSYSNYVIYRPRNWNRLEFEELIGRHGLAKRHEDGDQQIWSDDAKFYPILYVVRPDHLVVGPGEVLQQVWNDDKRFINRRQLGDVLRWIPPSAISFTIEDDDPSNQTNQFRGLLGRQPYCKFLYEVHVDMIQNSRESMYLRLCSDPDGVAAGYAAAQKAGDQVRAIGNLLVIVRSEK